MDKKPIQFAPLQGFTEAPFRNLHEKYFGGVASYFTPFLRIQHHELRRKDQRDVLPENNFVHELVPQILASEQSEVDLLVRFLMDNGYRRIDINMGCPFPMLMKRHKGSGILPFPEEVARLLQVVRRFPEVRFSVKMRLGNDQADECLRLAELLNETPLVQVAVHARLGSQQYRGTCDREAFRAFSNVCRHPIVYNGDVLTLKDLEEVSTDFPKLSAIMIGRGLLAKPWLAAEFTEGKAWDTDRKQQQLRLFHDRLLDHYVQAVEGGEMQLLRKLQSFWEYFLSGSDRKLLKKINKATKISTYTDAVYQVIRSQI